MGQELKWRIVLKPTEETKRRLSQTLSHAPSPVSDPEQFTIPLGEMIVDAATLNLPSSTPEYTVRPIAFGHVQRFSSEPEPSPPLLLLFVDAPEVLQLARTLFNLPEDIEGRLAITLSDNYTAGRTNRSWATSVHETLVTKEAPYTYSGVGLEEIHSIWDSRIFEPNEQAIRHIRFP